MSDIKALQVLDTDGYKCSLVRLHSEPDTDEIIATIIQDPDGEKILETVNSKPTLTAQCALEQIQTIRGIEHVIKKIAEGCLDEQQD